MKLTDLNCRRKKIILINERPSQLSQLQLLRKEIFVSPPMAIGQGIESRFRLNIF